jgi:hypothetical protein
MSLLTNLPHTVTHYRRKYSRGDYLDTQIEDEQQATGISAWVQNASQGEIERYQKKDESITHKVYFASDPGMRSGDVITVTAGPSFVGKTLNYRALTDRSAGLGVLFGAMFDEEDNQRASFDD